MTRKERWYKKQCYGDWNLEYSQKIRDTMVSDGPYSCKTIDEFGRVVFLLNTKLPTILSVKLLWLHYNRNRSLRDLHNLVESFKPDVGHMSLYYPK